MNQKNIAQRSVAIYARVSTRDRQETANQLDQLREYCANMGWTIVREYVDKASGKSGERTEFQNMFTAASRREFDLVLFWALDRFSREGVSATLRYLERLTSYGVDYKSFTEQYLDSCGIFRDAVISILATVAKQERLRLSERVTAGLDRARKAGRILGRPSLSEEIRQQVLKLRSSGLTLQEIAEQLDISKRSVSRIRV